ncbi:hypothetical protein VDG1235_806 [Verrucomicrobiia bacterium DG1235]|nr:hypothetical protein VDG1235_806 [Verrucomicrobiae bacterium DG1235]
MKTLIASLIAATAAVSTLQAHCGTCSVSEGADAHHGEAHASCYDGTLSSYFAIQKALAGDDLPAAKSAAAALQEGMSKSECATDGADCCAEVGGASDAIAQAADIAAARSAFLGFSKAMIAQMESHGSETAAYQMYCPMAFNNKGGAWLQDSSDLRNPYYGSMMLTCGMQKTAYGPAAEKHSHDGHEHHSH